MSAVNASPESSPPDYSLTAVQQRLCAYIRDPESSEPPEGLELRRLDVYRDLVFNNVESLLGGSFPVLKSIQGDRWKTLVRQFLSDFRASTPYFTRLPKAFFLFIRRQRAESAVPLFVEELAHHELVELELLYRQDEVRDQSAGAAGESGLSLSPLAEISSYVYPVHRLSATHLPDQPPEDPTYMLQFRNPEGRVVFMQLSAFAYQLLSLIALHPGYAAHHWLESLADALAATTPRPAIEHFKSSGRSLIEKLSAAGALRAAANP